jgi:glutamate-1-semialdehyde 2,1-aminomutase
MLLRGQYVTPRGMIALSLPFTRADIDRFTGIFDEFLTDYRSILPARQ